MNILASPYYLDSKFNEKINYHEKSVKTFTSNTECDIFENTIIIPVDIR